MTIPRRRTLVCWLMVAMLGLAAPMQARAQATPTGSSDTAEPPTFLLHPVDHDGTYFSVTQEPGTEQQFTVALGNAGEEPVTALTYVADAYSLANGGFGIEAADDPSSGATEWINYPTETLDLSPQQTLERTFTVSVPEDAAPGQYIAGLAIETAEPVAVGDSEMLRQIIQKSIAVFITVPGPTSPELQIGQARITQTPTANRLIVEIENPGNVFVAPSGSIAVTTENGEPVLTSPVAMGTIYAGTATTLELNIPTLLSPGTYTVSLTLEDADIGANAEIVEVPVTIDELPGDATPSAEPVTVESVQLEPLSDPSTDTLQAIQVSVTLDNPQAGIPSARLTLHVNRDGELVEDYLLSSALVVQAGTTEIVQRYVPLGSWEPGTYSFALTLESVDPNSGQVTVLATHAVEETVEVP